MVKLNPRLPLSAFKPFFLISLCGLLLQTSAMAAVPVTTQPLADLTIFPDSSAPATVVSLNDSELSAQVTAVVINVPTEVGAMVSQGSVLVQLERTDFELALQQSRATLASLRARSELATSQLRRVRALAKKKSASMDLLQQRQAEVKSLAADISAQQVEIKMAQRDLQHCDLVAPFDALVLERQAQIGELASPGKPLVRVLEIGQLEVEAKVQPDDVAALRLAAKISFNAGERRYPLTIHSITAALDKRDRSRTLRLKFSADRALAYTAGLLVWQHAQPHLPAELLVRRNGMLGIMIANRGEAEFVPLKNASEGRPTPITLPSDTLVIVDGRFRVQSGDTLLVDE